MLIDKIAGNRIFFEDGSAFYISQSARNKFIATVDEYAHGERFKSVDLKDIMPGDRVYYYFTSGEIYGMIVVK